jgi:hypothetical protein
VAVGVPETLRAKGPRLVVLPGPNEATGFLGENVGRVLRGVAELASLGWPYAAASSEAASAIRSLEPGLTSGWIEVPTGDAERTGTFRAYRAADGSLYVSPTYRAFHQARDDSQPTTDSGVPYVADDPAWAPESEIAQTQYVVHVGELADARARRATAEGKGADLLVYYDGSVALVQSAFSRDGTEKRFAGLRGAYQALDARVGALLSEVGPAASVVLIGREPNDVDPTLPSVARGERQRATGFFFATDTPGWVAGNRAIKLTDIRAALLTSLRLHRQRIAMASVSSGGQSRDVAFEAAALGGLGLLTDSTTAPVADEATAQRSSVTLPLTE